MPEPSEPACMNPTLQNGVLPPKAQRQLHGGSGRRRKHKQKGPSESDAPVEGAEQVQELTPIDIQTIEVISDVFELSSLFFPFFFFSS